MKNKGLIIFLIAAVILAGGYYFISSKRNGANNKQEEEVSHRNLVYKELVDKYKAKTGWEKGLNYTIQAQERLTSGTPIIFEGFVEDVFIRDEKTFITFDDWLSNIRLELECDQQIINKFFSMEKKSGSLLNTYAVVANIQEVSKPVFKVGAYSVSEEEAEVEIQSSELIIGRGTCIDIAIIDEF